MQISHLGENTIFVVLATERRNCDGNFPDFEKCRDAEGVVYVGGHVRMQTAVCAARQYPRAEFVMAGGWLQENDTLLSKALDMADYMREQVGTCQVRVVNSLPSTRGNLVALFNAYGRVNGKQMIVLCNDYHAERIGILWGFVQKSEGYEYIPPFQYVVPQEFGVPEVADPQSKEYELRVKIELRGIERLLDGSYVQSNRVNLDVLLNHIPESVDVLLTPREKQEWLLSKLKMEKEIGKEC